jgi:C4-type Zn-finger protein
MASPFLENMVKWEREASKEKEVCCVCGEFAEEKCSHCKNPYCLPHFKSVVMTGNCCSGNEKDYEI